MAVEQLERESSGRHRESVGAPVSEQLDCETDRL